jgi:hypothetical protein
VVVAAALDLARPDEAASLESAKRRPVRSGARRQLARRLGAGRESAQDGPLPQAEFARSSSRIVQFVQFRL